MQAFVVLWALGWCSWQCPLRRSLCSRRHVRWAQGHLWLSRLAKAPYLGGGGEGAGGCGHALAAFKYSLNT